MFKEADHYILKKLKEEKACYLEKGNIEIIDIDDSNALHLFAPIYVLSPKGLYTSFFYVTLGVDKDLTL